MEMSQVIAVLGMLGGLVGVWVNTQTKIKEIEIRMISLEKSIAHVESQDSRIEEKIDNIYAKLEKVMIALEKKQDK